MIQNDCTSVFQNTSVTVFQTAKTAVRTEQGQETVQEMKQARNEDKGKTDIYKKCLLNINMQVRRSIGAVESARKSWK